MALTIDWHVDASVVGTGGDGSPGNPFGTFQEAIDAAAGGDVIGLGNNLTHILSGPINWDTGWSAGTSPDAPLIITLWDNAGTDLAKSIVEIQSDNTVFGGTGTVPTDVYHYNIQYQANYTGTGTPTSHLISQSTSRWRFEQCRITGANNDGMSIAGAGWNVIGCEIDNCVDDGIAVSSSAGTLRIVGCWIHDNGASAIDIPGANAIVAIMFCRFNGNANTQPTVLLSVSPNNAFIAGNSFLGSNGTSEFGIDIDAASEEITVIGNIFKNYGGASGGAVTVESGGKLAVYGYNNFDNCTTTYNAEGSASLDLVIDLGNDLTETVAFTDVANGDFSHSVSALTETMLAFGIPMNYGVDQSNNLTVGGGGLFRHPGMTGGMNG